MTLFFSVVGLPRCEHLFCFPLNFLSGYFFCIQLFQLSFSWFYIIREFKAFLRSMMGRFSFPVSCKCSQTVHVTFIFILTVSLHLHVIKLTPPQKLLLYTYRLQYKLLISYWCKSHSSIMFKPLSSVCDFNFLVKHNSKFFSLFLSAF